jgi:hypothetical protein
MSLSDGDTLPDAPGEPEEPPEDDATACERELLLHAADAKSAPHARAPAVAARLARATGEVRVVIGMPPGRSLRPGDGPRIPSTLVALG